jgi:hypothetical protein
LSPRYPAGPPVESYQVGLGRFLIAGSVAGALSGLISPGFVFGATMLLQNEWSWELVSAALQQGALGFILFFITLPLGTVFGLLVSLLVAFAHRWAAPLGRARFLAPWLVMVIAGGGLSALAGWTFLPVWLWAVPTVLLGAGALLFLQTRSRSTHSPAQPQTHLTSS